MLIASRSQHALKGVAVEGGMKQRASKGLGSSVDRGGHATTVSLAMKRRAHMLRSEFKLEPSHVAQLKDLDARAREIEASADDGFSCRLRLGKEADGGLDAVRYSENTKMAIASLRNRSMERSRSTRMNHGSTSTKRNKKQELETILQNKARKKPKTGADDTCSLLTSSWLINKSNKELDNTLRTSKPESNNDGSRLQRTGQALEEDSLNLEAGFVLNTIRMIPKSSLLKSRNVGPGIIKERSRNSKLGQDCQISTTPAMRNTRPFFKSSIKPKRSAFGHRQSALK